MESQRLAVGNLGPESRKTSARHSRASVLRVGKMKSAQKEIGMEELVVTGLLVDGAVWSTSHGLYVDRSIRGLTRLPPLRIRAATPRAAEFIMHQRFPQATGCLELPVHRILRTPWPVGGTVNSSQTVETTTLLSVRLPFVWGGPSQRWHPVGVFDAPPAWQLQGDCLCLSPPPENSCDVPLAGSFNLGGGSSVSGS